MIINKVNIVNISFIMKLMVNHFGRKPMKGGNPPRDKKFIRNNNFVCLDWLIALINLDIWYRFNLLNVITRTNRIIV